MMNNDFVNGKTFRSMKTIRDDEPGTEGSSSRSDNPTMASTPSTGGGRAEKSRFQIGDILLDKYVITAALGQGGMGVVYKCFDKVAGVEVAVKMVPPELSQSTVDMEDVRDNFQFVTKLVHQNIAISKNLERDPVTGDYYLVMECVEGEDLRRWIRRKQRSHALTLEAVLPVVRQIADALDYAHAQNVIHRDVKPANVMISIDGFVKVLDFGLAAKIHTSLSQLTMGNQRKSGTAPYMSPEQWRGHPQEGAADQYALGVMVYEMLAGHLPFENPDMEALRFAVLNDKPRELKNQPASVCAAIDRAMSKNPDDRFETCADFVAALAGGKVKAKKPARDKTSSSRGGAIAAALAGLLLIGGGVFLYQNQRHAEKQAAIVAEQKRVEDEQLAAKNKAEAEKRLLAEKERAEREKKDLDTLISENLNHLSGLQYAQDTLKLDEMDQGQTFGDKIRTFKIKFEAGKRAQEKEGRQYQKIANQNFAEAKKAVDWIVKNSKLRKTAQALLATIEAKKKSADEFDADNLASNLYNKASAGIAKGKLAYEQGDFASAIQGLKEGITDYEAAYASARKIMIERLEAAITIAQGEKNWSRVKELAEKMRPFDAEKAQELSADADERLKNEETIAERQRMIDNYRELLKVAKESNDWNKVFSMSKIVAETGDAFAQCELGICYDFGRGVVKDETEAARWYRKAAEQGYASAQRNLGISYANPLKKSGMLNAESEYVATNASDLKSIVDNLRGGEVIRLTGNVYELKDAFYIKKHCTIIGRGIEETKIVLRGGDFHIWEDTNGQQVVLKNLTVDCGKNDFSMRATTNVRLEDCKFENSTGYQAIRVSDHCRIRISRCKILGEIHSSSDTHIIIEDSHIENRNDEDHAIYAYNGNALVMKNTICIANDKYGAVYINEKCKVVLQGCRIFNRGNGSGIRIGDGLFYAQACNFEGGKSAVNATHHNAIFNSCRLASQTGYGFDAAGKIEYYDCSYSGSMALIEMNNGVRKFSTITCPPELNKYEDFGLNSQEVGTPIEDSGTVDASCPKEKLYGTWEGDADINGKTLTSGNEIKIPAFSEHRIMKLFENSDFRFIQRFSNTQKETVFHGTWSYANDMLKLKGIDGNGRELTMTFEIQWQSDSSFILRQDTFELARTIKTTPGANIETVNCSYNNSGELITEMTLQGGVKVVTTFGKCAMKKAMTDKKPNASLKKYGVHE